MTHIKIFILKIKDFYKYFLCREIIFIYVNRTQPTKANLFYKTQVYELNIFKELGKIVL